MRENDSLELKIIRVALPLLIYFGVQLCVQVAFGIYAMWYKFVSIEGSGSAHYILAYNFLDNTEEYLNSHSLAALFISAVITLVILFFIRKKERKDIRSEWAVIDGREFLLLIFLGVFAAGGLGKLVTIIPFEQLGGDYVQVAKGFKENPMLFQILTLCIAAPLVEEVVFRGMMYGRLKEYMEEIAAAIVSAVIFGIYHGNLTQGVYALLLGVLLCLVKEKCGSMAAPVLLHMSCNTAALVMMYLPVSTKINQDMISKILMAALELAGMGVFFYLFYRGREQEGIKEDNRKEK